MNFEFQLKTEEPNDFEQPLESTFVDQEIFEGYESYTQIPPLLRKEIIDALSNTTELFLGSGNYGVVLKNIKYKDVHSFCIKLTWNALEIFEGEKYSDEGDDYIKGLKKIKNYFDEIKADRAQIAKERNNEFAPQNTPKEEFEKMRQAYAILKEAKIDCYIPKPYLCGFDELDDTFMLEEDTEEQKQHSVYERNNYNLFVMEMVKGKNLQEIADHLEDNRELADLFIQNKESFCNELRKAVSTLNQHNIKHGDLHMRNIMIDNNGKPALIDFGVNTNLHDRNDMEDLESTLRDFQNKLNIDK